MCFKKQGEANLNIALCLHKKNMHELGKMNRKELASIIINRLYYGVFLMAKELVKQNGEQPSIEHKNLWKQVCKLLMKRPIDITLLSDFTRNVDLLRTTRNIYDYEEYLQFEESKINKAVDKSLKYKQEIYDILSQYI